MWGRAPPIQITKQEFQFGVLYILRRKDNSRKEKETMTKREAKTIGRCGGCGFWDQGTNACLSFYIM